MENALIVSYTEKGNEFFEKMLRKISCRTHSYAKTCGDARREISNKNFDICIINSPVYNESGEDLAKEIVLDSACQVIFIVKGESYDYASVKLEELGVITVSKPINPQLFYQSLKISKAVSFRLKKLESLNCKLNEKLKDIKIIDRAKWVLVSYLNMNEEEAHKHIEKEAMDTRKTKRYVAEKILKTYEN